MTSNFTQIKLISKIRARRCIPNTRNIVKRRKHDKTTACMYAGIIFLVVHFSLLYLFTPQVKVLISVIYVDENIIIVPYENVVYFRLTEPCSVLRVTVRVYSFFEI